MTCYAIRNKETKEWGHLCPEFEMVYEISSAPQLFMDKETLSDILGQYNNSSDYEIVGIEITVKEKI